MVSNIIHMWLTEKYVCLANTPFLSLLFKYSPYFSTLMPPTHLKLNLSKTILSYLPNLFPLRITFLRNGTSIQPVSYSTYARNLKVILDISFLHPSHPVNCKVLNISQICHLQLRFFVWYYLLALYMSGSSLYFSSQLRGILL